MVSDRDRLAALLREAGVRGPVDLADWLAARGVTLAAPAPAGPLEDGEEHNGAGEGCHCACYRRGFSDA